MMSLLFVLTLQGGFSYLFAESEISNVSTAETSLHIILMDNYCKDALPSRKVKTLITAAFHLTNLNSFDSRSQVVTITGWFHFNWTDERLGWNPTDFDGIDHIFVPQNKVWRPDIIPEKDAAHVGHLGYDQQYTFVHSNGMVEWSPSGIFNIPCQLDLTKFPFDTQECNFFTTSWTHTQKELQLEFVREVGLDIYLENEEWRLVNSTMLPYNTYDTYVGSNVVLSFQRKPYFYIVVLIFPAILSSLLNSLVFVLPPESGERITLSITSFLTFTIFISYISQMVPQNADNIPLIAVLLVLQSAISMVSLGCNILIVRINYSKRSSLVQFFSMILCKNRKSYPTLVETNESGEEVKCSENGELCVEVREKRRKRSRERKDMDVKSLTRKLDKVMCTGFFIASILLFVIFIICLIC